MSCLYTTNRWSKYWLGAVLSLFEGASNVFARAILFMKGRSPPSVVRPESYCGAVMPSLLAYCVLLSCLAVFPSALAGGTTSLEGSTGGPGRAARLFPNKLLRARTDGRRPLSHARYGTVRLSF